MEKTLYYSLNQFLKEKFGEKVRKIPLDAGFTCPNRDGTKGKGGCIYCDLKGSGTGLGQRLSLKEQIEFFLERFKKRGYQKFIAYFQSFSNTYGPLLKLKETYRIILNYPEIVGLAIGTRPDCIDKEVIKLLKEFQHLGYYLWIELGLQSKHNQTLKLINRGHTFEDFLSAYYLLKEEEIPVVVHIIFGLPKEDREMMLETVETLSELKPEGIKFHALYILEGTPLSELYKAGQVRELSLEEYRSLVGEALSLLPRYTVIHRLTSDPPKEGLLAPLWLLDKNKVLNAITDYMKEKSLYQGKFYKTSS
ncbi:MAG: TIGR01212 family radical SAM protein [Caldimicrobium sp.]|uniref:TIGR01212 family radical SAM protein n=1 Tax=Caldimicrobium thiodismutans TaxID=1653476 RepID=A0A2N7PJN7_9BACT|nr:MAG: TIGR01212 family radical SAM protein [Caldimicrobium thiodismutans]